VECQQSKAVEDEQEEGQPHLLWASDRLEIARGVESRARHHLYEAFDAAEIYRDLQDAKGHAYYERDERNRHEVKEKV